MTAPANDAALLALTALREETRAMPHDQTADYLFDWCNGALARLRATPPAAEPAPAATDAEPVASGALLALGARLANLLQDDDWNNVEPFLLAAATQMDAAEARGRASAEARCERLRYGLSAVVDLPTIEEAARLAYRVLTTDDAERGK